MKLVILRVLTYFMVGYFVGMLITHFVMQQRVSSLVCSNNVVLKDVKALYYNPRGSSYYYNKGSYTPKTGEVCIIVSDNIDKASL